MNSKTQSLANILADEFTLANLEELCQLFGVTLADFQKESRQKTANTLAAYLAEEHSNSLLEQRMREVRDDLPQPQSKSSPKRGIHIDTDIDVQPGEKGIGGTLSDSGTSPQKQFDSERASNRVVNTGFSDADNPGTPNKADLPLYADSDAYFWLEVGDVIDGSIETEVVEIDTSELPPEAILQVALFGFENEIKLTAGQDTAELRISPQGNIVVHKPAAQPSGISAEQQAARLFFPIRTPTNDGTYRLRCNIYYQQTLLQSRLVSAMVMDDPRPMRGDNGPALRTDIDYIISKTLDSSQLTKMQPNTLSVMLNSNDEGSHGFRFFGGSEFKNDASLDADELQNLISLARGALRKAAWGDEEPFTASKPYRYDEGFDLKRLRIDLFRCAIRGYRFYDVLINRLAGDADRAWDLADMMLKPGSVQIASKQSARLVVPAAMIYDYPLDTGLKSSQFELCSEFTTALKNKTPLADCRCFQGDCPHYDADNVVCPSGFWGYRHAIGMPVTIPNGPDAPIEIKMEGGAPEISVAVSQDPNFIGREKHEANLKKLHPDLKWNYANERPETIDMMKKTSPNVLYFFCHGRLANDTPSIEVGPPKTRGITRDNLRSKRIRWRNTRPLVFINGCHTTALEPDKAIDLVGGFIDTSHAAGVIGTEITNFVPVARDFAEIMLKEFMVDGKSIGEAVRSGRLAILQQGNPLGLMYVPYVMTGLKLV